VNGVSVVQCEELILTWCQTQLWFFPFVCREHAGGIVGTKGSSWHLDFTQFELDIPDLVE